MGTMREVWEEPQISVAANDGVHVPRTCRVDIVELVCPGGGEGKDIEQNKTNEGPDSTKGPHSGGKTCVYVQVENK